MTPSVRTPQTTQGETRSNSDSCDATAPTSPEHYIMYIMRSCEPVPRQTRTNCPGRQKPLPGQFPSWRTTSVFLDFREIDLWNLGFSMVYVKQRQGHSPERFARGEHYFLGASILFFLKLLLFFQFCGQQLSLIQKYSPPPCRDHQISLFHLKKTHKLQEK